MMPQIPPPICDVLIIGSGNAGFSAAISATQSGAKKVVLIDKCPEEWAGGNSYFTAGAMRTVHGGLEDLRSIVNNVNTETAQLTDLDQYTSQDFSKDLSRVCLGRSHPQLSKILIEDSNSAIKWLASIGVRFQLSFNRQAYKVDGRYRFWGGIALKTEDGGKGLIEDHRLAARNHGVEVFFSTAATALHKDTFGAVTAVSISHLGKVSRVEARAVIMAAGGFESSPRMRAQFLGPNWDLAAVRGTPYNTGDLLEIAQRDVSAATTGNWSGCHSTCWDANAPKDAGDREVGNEFTKSGYPLGVMINADGERFVDEGIDMRNFTYAKFGRAILNQPGSVAFQIWDMKMIPWLRDEEYRESVVQRITADSLEELAEKCTAVGLSDPDKFVQTLEQYNKAVYAYRKENQDAKWDPTVKDGLSTQSSTMKLQLAKSNWAVSIDEGPFLAVKVTGGVTFTFGGLKVDPETTNVIDTVGEGVKGLFCAGEMLGGLFYDNYPGGSGLTSGTVFGRRAGAAAAKVALGPVSGDNERCKVL